jgi:hypothetical protein
MLAKLAALVFWSALLAGCRAETTVGTQEEKLAVIPESVWSSMSNRRILFGHQSVGMNILEGVQDLATERPGKGLSVVKYSAPDQMNVPGLFHALVGENDDPASKISSFTKLVEGGLGDRIEIAFFKFCYVDIVRDTDVDRLFADYRQGMESLKKRYPRVKFVHVTVPLTTPTPAFKALVKRLMGKEENNVNRNRFNDLLRREYEGREPVFDLARVESTYPDGRRATFARGKITYSSMVPDYTDDGGHLNKKGRKIAARELLIFLASL